MCIYVGKLTLYTQLLKTTLLQLLFCFLLFLFVYHFIVLPMGGSFKSDFVRYQTLARSTFFYQEIHYLD